MDTFIYRFSQQLHWRPKPLQILAQPQSAHGVASSSPGFLTGPSVGTLRGHYNSNKTPTWIPGCMNQHAAEGGYPQTQPIPVFKWQARGNAYCHQLRLPRELVSMVTLMVLLENGVRLCASARAWAKECVRSHMKEGKGCNDWLKRWVAVVRLHQHSVFSVWSISYFCAKINCSPDITF